MKKTKKFMLSLCLSALASGLFLSSCGGKDDAPKPTTEEPQNKNSETLKLLQAPDNGWEVAIYPSNNQRYGGYTLFLSFGSDGSVRTASELQASDATQSSQYSVETQANTQTLSFTTANPAIALTTESSDPTLSQLAAYRDEAFTIESATANEIRLVGKANGSIAVLRPASTQPWAEQLSAIQATASNNVVLHFRLRNDSEEIGTGEVRVSNRHLSITERNGATQSRAFRYTANGIELFSPLTVQGLQMQKLTSEQSSNSASFKASESNLSLVATATPLSEILRLGLFTYAEANTTGRAKTSFTRFNSLLRTLNNGISENKQHKLHQVQIGLNEGKFGLHVKYRLGSLFAATRDFNLTLPVKMAVINSHQVSFTYDLTSIVGDSDLELLTNNSPYLQILAAGFGKIGAVNYPLLRQGQPDRRWYNESYEAITFDLTADNAFRPTEITLTNVTDETHTIKLQIPQN